MFSTHFLCLYKYLVKLHKIFTISCKKKKKVFPSSGQDCASVLKKYGEKISLLDP